MSFLAPLFLLGALAIALPVIFHLVRRSTRERTRFSSLMFLKPSPPRLTRRSRLEQLLLLMLRCLALGLLAFGFARPFLKQSTIVDASGAPMRRVVLLVDTSASMQRAGLWDQARARAEAIVRSASPVDRIALFAFDRQVTPLLNLEEWAATPVDERVPLALGRLATVSPGWGGTNLGNALVSAAEALAEKDQSAPATVRQIVLLGDVQSGSRLEALQAYEWPRDVELVLEPLRARAATNAGLQWVAEAADTARATDSNVRVRVSNAADSTREEFQVGWARAEGNAFAGAPIDVYVPPGQSRVVAVPLPAGGIVSDRIILRGDDEPFDNTVHALPPSQQQVKVLYLGADSPDDSRQPLFFLRRALPVTPNLAVEVTARTSATPLTPADARVPLAFVTDNLPPAHLAVLRERLLAGQTIVAAPKNPEAGAAIARLLDRESLPIEEARLSNYAMFAEIDFQHPLFAPFADPRFSDFTKIHVWKYRRFDTTALPEARVLARFDTGDPALLEIPAGRGRIFLFATGWNPDDSQLAVSSKFVPLLFSALEFSGGVITQPHTHVVGDPLPVNAEEGDTVTVQTPRGVSIALAADARVFAPTQAPGIYRISMGGRTQRIPVNLDPSESRTAPLAADELEQLGAPIAKAAPELARQAERNLALHGVEAESRQKLWRWFIVATLGVLLVESALAGWTARRRTAAAAIPT